MLFAVVGVVVLVVVVCVLVIVVVVEIVFVHAAVVIMKCRSPKHPALFVTANISGELGLWNLNHSMEEPFAPPVKVQSLSLRVD